jgi:rhamnogalacturonan endolyase
MRLFSAGPGTRCVHRFLFSVGLFAATAAAPLFGAPQLERLDRGVVAIHQPDGKVFVSWRLLADDPDAVAFNLYRQTAPSENVDWGAYASQTDPRAGVVKVNAEPLAAGTWFVDGSATLSRQTSYFVRAVVSGEERAPSRPFVIPAGHPPLPYWSIALHTPEGYTPGDASIADLDGDGDYEIIVKQEGRSRDNSQRGETDPVFLQAYDFDSTGSRLLWQIDLGRNIRAGAHYTQFIVYDFDGDGRAEIACRTADGTIDGTGKVIGDAQADHRNSDGFIIRGPEFLTIFDGRTGAELVSVPYVPSRHPTVEDPTPEQMAEIWGDGRGNRMDRFLAGVAYLDGERPSLIMCRGYYTRSVIVAWDWRDGQLTQRWIFDSSESPENKAYAGQGFHSLSIADVDGDGRQEIIYGSMVLDDDGTGLYSTGWGHGDALHVSDLVPENPGLEVMGIQERFDQQGINLRDARTGRPLVLIPSVKAADSGDDRGEGPGRGVAINIDPRFPGSEMWAAGAGMNGVWSAQGERIMDRPRRLPVNFAVWWDGDLLRELLDQNFILKWDWEREQLEPLLVAHDCSSNNGTKATPALSADLWGDWREEVIWRSRDNRELRIYTSTHPTDVRLTTLMHDPQYRVASAWQNVAYNQPPHPSFALDPALPLPPRPRIGFAGSKP